MEQEITISEEGPLLIADFCELGLLDDAGDTVLSRELKRFLDTARGTDWTIARFTSRM